MALLSNPGFVAMLAGVEKTASGADYYFIDHPTPFLMVNEGDTFTLTADHNQSSVTSIRWEESSNSDFTTGVIELAFTDATCDTTHTGGSTTTVNCDSTAKMVVGQVVTGTGIPADTTITSITSATAFVISNAATATNNNTTLTFTYSDISGGLTLAVTIGPVKEARFPRPVATGGGGRWDRNRYFRCKIVHSGTTYYSGTTEVMCDWPDPAGVKQAPGTITNAHDP